MRLVVATMLVALQASVFANQGGGDDAFAQAVTAYIEVHRGAAAGLPAVSVADPEAAMVWTTTLAERIRARRQSARTGDVLGPAESRIRAIVKREMSAAEGAAIWSAIKESNVYGARVRVNHRYPPGLPRATMPGQLLAQLPPLPKELEYRFLGRSLLLVDQDAQLIVDVLPDVLPLNKQ